MHVEELLAHHTSNVHYTESINNMKAHDMRNCYVINDSFGISFHFGASMIKYVISDEASDLFLAEQIWFA